MVTISNADKALKTFYLGVLADQLNVGVNPLLAKIGQTTADVWGKEVKKLAPYGINGGIGSGEEATIFPQAEATTTHSSRLRSKTSSAKLSSATRLSAPLRTARARSSTCSTPKWTDCSRQANSTSAVCSTATAAVLLLRPSRTTISQTIRLQSTASRLLWRV